MACLEGMFGSNGKFTKPLEAYITGKVDVSDPENGTSFMYFIPDSEKEKVDAACKLEANFVRVVQDITNPGPNNIDGKYLSQPHLQRVDPKHIKSVEAMVKAACSGLRGNAIAAPPKDQAQVWEQAAKFLGGRVQGSSTEMPGRAADMSLGAAAAMRTVLGHIEVASKLIWNRETIVKDITNAGPRGVKGGELSQTHLKRLDPEQQAVVDVMIGEVALRLLGNSSQMTSWSELSDPDAKEKVLVWADAASFFCGRIQGPSDKCEPPHMERKADMSSAAAQALSTTLARMEAAHRLASNYERVVQDITNPKTENIDGKTLTQLHLKRVDSKHKESVEEMVKAVCSRLLGQEASGPSTPEEALVWVQAATFLSGRIQKSKDEMPGSKPDTGLLAVISIVLGGQKPAIAVPGRAPDMSFLAGISMLKVLGQIEAASALMSNRQTVVQDICNPGASAVKGGQVTQTDLKRLQPGQQSSVDAMISEVSGRLLGKSLSKAGPSDAQVWADAAQYLHKRIQSTSKEMPGRNRDMSVAAATAMRVTLAQISLGY